MPAFTTAVQHCTGCSNKRNWARKQNKRHQNWKQIKLSLFTEYHDPIFRNSQRIHKKVTGVNKSKREKLQATRSTHKPIMFLCTSNKCFKKQNNSICKASKIIKYLENNQEVKTKEVKHLYFRNYKHC